MSTLYVREEGVALFYLVATSPLADLFGARQTDLNNFDCSGRFLSPMPWRLCRARDLTG